MSRIPGSRCPYCGGMMEEGYIENWKGPILWSPKETRSRSLRSHADPRKNQREIGTYTFADGGRARAWYCPACEIAILCNNEIREAVL